MKDDFLDPIASAFYCQALVTLSDANVSFLVGGAYALGHYAGITRHTKDLDVFVRPRDCDRALKVLSLDGCRTELTFPHWLGKAICGSDLIDIIFSSGNGIAEVDDVWFKHASEGEIFGVPVRFCPPEEMIWSKAFLMERERYDGADIAHLFRACGERMDWQRLLRRFGPHWRVLLSHLILFGFVYPTEHSLIPDWIMQEPLGRLQNEIGGLLPRDRLCQGTLLSRVQYLEDIERWGYQDARLLPSGAMTPEEAAQWTVAGADQAH